MIKERFCSKPIISVVGDTDPSPAPPQTHASHVCIQNAGRERQNAKRESECK